MRLAQSTIGFQDKHRRPEETLPTAIDELVPLFAAMGWDGIEIWEPHLAGLAAAALRDLGRRIADHGLQVPMLSGYYDFTTSEESAERSLAEGRRVLAEARLVGAQRLRIFTGKTRSRDADDQQWERCARSLRQLCDAAAGDGIALALHLHDWNLIDTAEGTLRLIALVERRNLEVLFKPSIYHPHHLAVYDALRPHVASVHLTPVRAVAGRHEPCRLVEADLDVAGLVDRLRRDGDCGWLTLNWMSAGAEAAGRDAAAWLRALLGPVTPGTPAAAGEGT